MYRIKTMNKISPKGLAVLEPALYEVGDAVEQEDGILVRSAALHDYEFPENLRAIARAGAGTNNIPIDRCTQSGIAVFNTPGANANAVKELVICALLLSSRKIPAGIAWVKEQAGGEAPIDKAVEKGKSQFTGPELAGKTLGVWGLGAIGARVANAALALGMDVCGYDPFLSAKGALALDPRVTVADELDAVLSACDYLTIHVPLNDQTRGALGTAALAKMKDGARVINMARGGLVDDDALIAALTGGKLSCYVTDFPDDKILAAPNTVCLPHLGASTPESEENCALMAAQEMDAYLGSGNVYNSVNFPALEKAWTDPVRVCVFGSDPDGKLSDAVSGCLAQSGVAPSGSAVAERAGYSYLLIDLSSPLPDAAVDALMALDGVIRVRVLSRE